ncbi:MAG: S-ribosylhomocysteine lyase [Ruminococcus sp.]|nr:S-ribosylhomocysteine lyase [Ruminococcus sp.]
MGKLTFAVTAEKPVLLGKYLRGECGVSAGLLRRTKNRELGITCNGKPVRTVDLVRNGDEIILDCGGENSGIQPNPRLNADIVLENDSLVIFNKPAGMPVHPSAKHRDDTLGNLFAHLYPELVFRPVNRLDKDTSGLCVIAKDPYAASRLGECCRKTYYAAVHGLTEQYGTIDAPIARQSESVILRCVREDGRAAVTHYEKIAQTEKYSLLKIRLETGRTHQIRVHFSFQGHPLAGDDLYGGCREDIGRQALHCGEITFTDPVSDEILTVTAPLPEDITGLFIKGDIEMKKIASFQVDHTKFGVGMYISRADGDVVTYDVRMVKPNGGEYISNPSLHTIEHLFATYARNSRFSDSIVYVGPMGCRTGFYLLTRDSMSGEDAIGLVRDAYRFIADFEGEIPGCTVEECGNYLEHDLESAKKDVLPLLNRLENYTAEMLDYGYGNK